MILHRNGHFGPTCCHPLLVRDGKRVASQQGICLQRVAARRAVAKVGHKWANVGNGGAVNARGHRAWAVRRARRDACTFLG